MNQSRGAEVSQPRIDRVIAYAPDLPYPLLYKSWPIRKPVAVPQRRTVIVTPLPDPLTAAVVALIFVAAGMVKGVIGLGLPTVSLGLLVLIMNLPAAMGMMIVPSLATNLWQAVVGGHAGSLLRRFWPFLITAAATVWLGVFFLSHIRLSLLTSLLGVLLAVYAGFSLFGLRVVISKRREPLAGLLAGAANGVLTGMTGSFVVPGVLYLQARGLSRDQLIQAMGILFAVLTVALGLALRSNNLFGDRWLVYSALALIPAGAGMILGQRIRRHLPERHFRRVFFGALLVLGVYVAANSLPPGL